MDSEGKHNTEFAQDEEKIGDKPTVTFAMRPSQLTESILSFLERPYLMDVLDWVPGLSFTYSTIVSTYFKRNSAARGKLDGYKYIRATVEFVFRVNTTKMQYGQFIAGYFPQDVSIVNRSSAPSLLLTEHVMVSAATQGDVVLSCPYVYTLPIAQITQPSGGTVKIVEYNPLLSISGGATVASISVFVRFVNVTLHAYTDSVPYIREQSLTHMYQDGINGFDTVLDSHVPTPFQLNDVTYSALDAHAGPEITQFSDTYKYPHFVGTYMWSLADIVSTQLGAFRVTPNQQTFPNTYLQHIACTHNYWSGTLRFMIQVVASQFHSGRLQISYEPKSVAQVGLLAHQSANIVLDVQGQSEVVFDIPWMNSFPWSTSIGDNGTIYVKVLNSLSSNTDSVSPVYVNVFLYGTSDLQFYAPLQLTGATALNRISVTQVQSEFYNFPNWMTVTGLPTPQKFQGVKEDEIVEEQYRNIAPTDTYPFADLVGIEIPQPILKSNGDFQQAGRVLNAVPLVAPLYDIWDPVFDGAANIVRGIPTAYFAYWSDMFAFRRGNIDVFVVPTSGAVSTIRLLDSNSRHPQSHGITVAPVRGPIRNSLRVPYISDASYQSASANAPTAPFTIQATTANDNNVDAAEILLRASDMHYYYLIPPFNLTSTHNNVVVV